MFFKTYSLAIKFLLSLLVIFAQSCSLPIFEPPPEEVAPQAKLDFEPKCLNNVLPVMSGFMNGTAEPSQIDSTWKCFSNGLELFYKKVKGTNNGVYSSDELAKFFEDYFFDGLVLSPTLRVEIMKIKQLIVGGDINSLTKQELKDLIRFSNVARQASLDVLPHMSVISINWKMDKKLDVSEQINKFNLAQNGFNKFVTVMAGQIKKNEKGYKISDLIVLLKEMGNLYGKNWTLLEQIQKYLPLVEKIKKTLIGGQAQDVGGQEWESFSMLLSGGYLQYLRYYYFIKNVPSEFAKYDMVFLFDSLDSLFSYLSETLSKKPNKELTSLELKESLESLVTIFPELRFSPKLAEQVLKVKKWILGGKDTSIASNEFERGRDKLKLLSTLSDKLYQYSDIYFLTWVTAYPLSSQEQEQLAKAALDLEQLGQEMGGIFESEYDLENLYVLFDELSLSVNLELKERSALNQFKQKLPFIIEALQVAAGKSKPILNKNDWYMALKFFSGAFADYLHYFYRFQKAATWRLGTQEHDLMFKKLSNRLSQLIDNSQGKLSFIQINKLIDAAYYSQLIDLGAFGPEELKKSVTLLLEKVLWPIENHKKKIPVQGLEMAHVRKLNEIWGDFKSINDWILSLNPQDLTPKKIKVSLGQISSKTLKAELSDLWVKPSYILKSDTSGLLVFDQGKKAKFAFVDLQNQNIWRALLRPIMQVYSLNQDCCQMTENQVTRLYKDATPIFESMGLLNPKDIDFAKNRFLEANLFLPSSNGDSLLNFTEAIQIAQYMWSGVLRHAAFSSSLRSECPIKTDKKAKVYVDKECWAKKNKEHLSTVLLEMPNAYRVYSKLDDISFLPVIFSVLKATGWKDKGPWVSEDDYSLVPHLLQYIEAIMFRFDHDNDNQLNTVEAMEAYPVFRATLKKFAPKGVDGESFLRGGYSYLLVNKKLPSGILETIEFLDWQSKEDEWEINLSRIGFSEVLSAIADIMSSGSKKDGKPDEDESEEDPQEDPEKEAQSF